MIFSELQFALFFAGYFTVHLLLPSQYRIYLIIAGGAIFYGWWRPDYLWVPLGLSLIAYFGAIWIDSADREFRYSRLCIIVTALFLPLLIVKYAYFILTEIFGILVAPESLLIDPSVVRWALPLGISFITFTAVAYVVDVYRQRFPPERSLAVMLGYILFFPHLIAGPILRPNELMPQLRQLRSALGARILLGVSIFTLGLVKKLVFADQISAAVEPVYAGATSLTAWHYLIAIYGFSVQIYCDFSGYTDMAIGLAYLLRIRLPTNFQRPYAAASPIEFWRRWHITLSLWLRDYLYIPLGGNRNGRARQIFNLFITMVLGGLWHGASWTFMIWGTVHGTGLALSHLFGVRSRLPRWLAVALTFHFVTLAWVFFRAPNLATAIRVIGGPFHAPYSGAAQVITLNAFPILLAVTFYATHRFDRHARLRWASTHISPAPQWGAIALLWIVSIAVSQGSSAKFIYFDF